MSYMAFDSHIVVGGIGEFWLSAEMRMSFRIEKTDKPQAKK